MKGSLIRHLPFLLSAPLIFLCPDVVANADSTAATDTTATPTVEASPPTFRPTHRVILGADASGDRFLTPETIEIDREGNLYYVDSHNARIGKIARDGRRLWEIDGREWGGDGFLKPEAIAVSSGLNLFLLDTGRQEIFRVNGRGEVAGVIAEDDLTDPRAIAETTGGRLVVYDAASAEVSVRAPMGGELWSFRPQGFRSRTRVGMSVIGEEEICLYTPGGRTIRIYHFRGGLKRTWKPRWTDDTSPRIGSVGYDREGRVAILDEHEPRLYVFDPLGNPLIDLSDVLGTLGFRGPGEVRWHEGVLVLSDRRAGRVVEIGLPPAGNRPSR